MNLFLHASAIASFFVGVALLSSAFILNFMQFTVKPSVEMMPCYITFLFSDFVFHRSLQHVNTSKSSMLNISFPSMTANFLMIALLRFYSGQQ